MDRDGESCCQHPVRAQDGTEWWLTCCFCGCSEKLRLAPPAKTHGPHIREVA